MTKSIAKDICKAIEEYRCISLKKAWFLIETMASKGTLRSRTLTFSEPFIIEVAIEMENGMAPVLDPNRLRHSCQPLADHIGDVREGSAKEYKGLDKKRGTERRSDVLLTCGQTVRVQVAELQGGEDRLDSGCCES